MITKNFDAMQRTMVFGRIYPTGVTSYSQLTEAHYLQDDNTVVHYASPFNATENRLQSYAFPYFPSSSYKYRSFLKYIGLGIQESADEVIPAEDYYDYKLTHIVSGSSSFYGDLALGNDVTLYTEGGVDYVRIQHTFINNSGTTRLVREIGLYGSVSTDSWLDNGTVLVYRKVLPTYQTFEVNGTLTVDIKIPLTEFSPNKPSA